MEGNIRNFRGKDSTNYKILGLVGVGNIRGTFESVIDLGIRKIYVYNVNINGSWNMGANKGVCI